MEWKELHAIKWRSHVYTGLVPGVRVVFLQYAPRVVTAAQQKAGKTITARITGRSDFGSKARINSSLAIMGVSPPMGSVVVEKHHPVTVQTIPQATAAKYPRTIHPESSISASRSLGARPGHAQSLSVQSIKVVD